MLRILFEPDSPEAEVSGSNLMGAPNNQTTLAVVFLFGVPTDLNLLRPKRLERFGTAQRAARRASRRMRRVNPGG